MAEKLDGRGSCRGLSFPLVHPRLSLSNGFLLQMAYEPLITPLVKHIRHIRDQGNHTWVIVDGLEVVCEMAMEAFELMTGRKAPRALMRKVCNETWERQCAPFQPQR